MPGPLELGFGLVPGLAWMIHIARKDDWEREPWRVVLSVFLLGAIAAVAVAFGRPRIEAAWPALDGEAARWLDAFAITALTEELAKLSAVALGALWLSEWDEPMDGLVYGAAAGLGFAAMENAYYLSIDGLCFETCARAFTAMLGHACFTAGGAFLLGLARLGGWRNARIFVPLAVLAAVLPHGLYDLLLTGSRALGLAALLLVVPGALVLFALQVRWARARSIAYHPRGG
ncbi:MAG: PrsW family intramembrane metalloprotease [Planctomycetes bacterium]|nr:PrsW family intramembrane metalloprotease [Planctomycetota bacterium]